MYRHGPEEIAAVTRVLQSGQWFRYGDAKAGHQGEAQAFEAAWSRTLGSPHACFTNSGTGALMACYAGLGLGPGDEVIVPGYTWIASATAPLALGVIPVLCDVNESLMLDPAAVERAITPRTKAICPVHMNGLAADMTALAAIARKYKIKLIEDACQCDGGLWTGGRRLGTIGDMAAYSFNFYKVIACGDGGMVVARRREHYERALIFHDAGVGFRAHAQALTTPLFAGINLRGNEILAAIMNVQLTRLKGIIRDLLRNRNAIHAAVAAAGHAPQPIPYNGGLGTGTGATLGYRFATESAARNFARAFAAQPVPAGASASLPIDSGRHVYANWEAILNRQGGPTPAGNPFLHPANTATAPHYAKEMLPKTLAILKRTVLIPVNPDWTPAQCSAVAQAITAAAAGIAAKPAVLRQPRPAARSRRVRPARTGAVPARR